MNAFSTKDFQQDFFDELELKFAKRGLMITAVSETLNVGRDAVYRRLRGDTILGANELMVLARKYNIPLDEPKETKRLKQKLYYPRAMREIKNELEFYSEFEVQCKFLMSQPNVVVDYATPELPFYYELFTPNLLAFKTYIYGLTAWNLDKWKGKEFRVEMVDPEVFKIAKRLVDPIFNLPGREIWSVGILDITLRQIEHAVDVGMLRSPNVIDDLFDEIGKTIAHMERMTKSGKRFAPGQTPSEESPKFQVYHNELTNTNNIIIVRSSENSFVFSTFVNPNYLVSTDLEIQNQLENWFENLIESSNVLHTQSNKYAHKYFRQLRRTVEVSRKRVDALML